MLFQTVKSVEEEEENDEEREEEEQWLTGAIFPSAEHSASQQGGLRCPIKQRPEDTDRFVVL